MTPEQNGLMDKQKKKPSGRLSKPTFLKQLSDSNDNRHKPSEESIWQARALIHTQEDLKHTYCGIGPFKPRWLQVLARKEAYLVVYCTILSGNDISQVILAILLAYYGNYGHRPRWMAFGVMCAAVSCFIGATPHFIYGPGQDAADIVETTTGLVNSVISNSTKKAKKTEVCYSEFEDTCVDSDISGGYIGPVILLFISQFIVGIAISIFYTIGVTYMDDNVSKKSYPIYYSITLLLRILGPVLGYLVGGKCLSLWIDPTQSPNLTRMDPRWLGAWWLGSLFIGCGLFFAGTLLFLFPRTMPGSMRREAKRVLRQVEKDKEAGGRRGVEYFASLAKTKKIEYKPTLSNLKKAFKRLFTNKLWVGNLFNTVTIVLALSGYWNFKPKYLENQFRKSATEANYYTGMASFSSVVLGTGVGGAVLRWIRPKPRFVAGYNIFVTLFLTAGFIVLMFIGCPKLTIVGPVDGSTVPDCSADCGCSDRFSPMCAEDQVTVFYSPCYAGCTKANTSASPIVFSGCQCIPSNISSPPLLDSLTASSPPLNQSNDANGYGTSGYCPEPCDTFFYYLIIQIIIKTVSSTGRVGSSVIHLRSVADEDKGLALGTLTVFISFFGFIPAPIIMGAIIDSSCLVWDKSCGVYGNCWLYDSDKFRTIIHLVPAVFTFISVFGDLVVFYYSRQLDLYGDKEDEVELEKKEMNTEEPEPLNPHNEEDFIPQKQQEFS
ncbi:Solute carrier organic anion transporter family member 74D-like 2 [Homarus americanus]|uniref:Solute carrier organic anion transporter family member n=1 Tax=Homarus americanus TaxID=6706 RepID=A0A8J5THC6_HOMAM|nr:Solute carrier organic anion transporter family member 74D-like 2 [Homarus americanus]